MMSKQRTACRYPSPTPYTPPSSPTDAVPVTNTRSPARNDRQYPIRDSHGAPLKLRRNSGIPTSELIGSVAPFIFFVSGVLFETLRHARFDFGPKVTHELDILSMDFDKVEEILIGDVIYR